MFKLERELDIPLVATNDSHYLCEDDHKSHDVMLCVQTGSKVQDAQRMRFDADQFFVKSAEQMERLFPDRLDILQRTQAIAERCNLKLNKSTIPSRSLLFRKGTRSTASLKRYAAKAIAASGNGDSSS